jgi:hypothetical protein
MALSWDQRRKLIYLGSFALFLIIVISIPTYLTLHQAPTCSDEKQNGTEEGIDCGGSCTKLCKPLQLRPGVLWQQSFEVAPGVYTAVAYVGNPNANAEAKNVPYVFRLYGPGNIVLAERKGVVYIPPGKNFAVVEAGIRADSKPISTSFDLDDNFTWFAVRAAVPVFSIRGITVSSTTTSPVIEADIQNQTFTDYGRINIVAIVYNRQDNAIAASKTYVDALKRQSVRHIIFTWPEAFTDAAIRVELIPTLAE